MLRMIPRIICGAAAIVAVSACAPPAVRSQVAPVARAVPACSTAASRVRERSVPEAAERSGVGGRVLGRVDGKPIEAALVELRGSSTFGMMTDSAGRFRFATVPDGVYRLQVGTFAYNDLEETVTVSGERGRELEVELTLEADPVQCSNATLMASAPPLALVRAESLTVHRVLASGARLRHTVVARPDGSGVRFESRIVNVGQVVAQVVSLCSPVATSPVLLALNTASRGCYGNAVAIASGDSIRVVTEGPLRGTAGRYQFRVHVVDPAELDATIELTVADAKPDAGRRP